MTIARILAQKGRDVATMSLDRTLRDVVSVLAAKHFGVIVIVDAGAAMIGIVSERDVVRAIAAQGCDALDAPVARYMTKEVASAAEGDDLLVVMQRMSTGRFRHMPIVREGQLVGLISTGDAVKYRLEQMEHEQSALREYISIG